MAPAVALGHRRSSILGRRRGSWRVPCADRPHARDPGPWPSSSARSSSGSGLFARVRGASGCAAATGCGASSARPDIDRRLRGRSELSRSSARREADIASSAPDSGPRGSRGRRGPPCAGGGARRRGSATSRHSSRASSGASRPTHCPTPRPGRARDRAEDARARSTRADRQGAARPGAARGRGARPGDRPRARPRRRGERSRPRRGERSRCRAGRRPRRAGRALARGACALCNDDSAYMRRPWRPSRQPSRRR